MTGKFTQASVILLRREDELLQLEYVIVAVVVLASLPQSRCNRGAIGVVAMSTAATQLGLEAGCFGPPNSEHAATFLSLLRCKWLGVCGISVRRSRLTGRTHGRATPRLVDEKRYAVRVCVCARALSPKRR